MENEKIPMPVIDRDMKNLYKQLTTRFREEGIPEFIVYEDLEKDIAYMPLDDERRIYLVKDDTDEKLLELLTKEFETRSCKDTLKVPMMYHALSDREYAGWIEYACMIAESMNIKLKQILFGHDEMSAGYSDKFLIMLYDDATVPEMLTVIAHELRHEWQHRYYPEWFDNYIQPEDDENGYLMQISEIDAEAFGLKAEGMIIGVNFLDTYQGLELAPEYREALRKRMNEIDLILSQKKINRIRDIIEIDKLFESVRQGQ